MILDRDTNDKAEMISRYNKIFQIFDELDDDFKCPVVDDYEIGRSCDTIFRYDLSSNITKGYA